MAHELNQVLILGVIARTPDLRSTPTGVPALDFTVAGEDRVLVQGALRCLPFYARCSMLGTLAESQAETLTPGTPVLVTGELESSAWTDPTSQERRSSIRVRAAHTLVIPNLVETTTDASGAVRRKGGRTSVRLIGNLTAGPKLRATPSGDEVCDGRLCVNEWRRGQGGPGREIPHCFQISAWREGATVLSEHRKGAPLMIEGRLTTDSWTDEGGTKHSVTQVEARELVTLTGRPATAPTPRQVPVTATAQPTPAPVTDRAPSEADLPF